MNVMIITTNMYINKCVWVLMIISFYKKNFDMYMFIYVCVYTFGWVELAWIKMVLENAYDRTALELCENKSEVFAYEYQNIAGYR